MTGTASRHGKVTGIIDRLAPRALLTKLPTFHWNFFRVHLLCHVAIPLVASGVFHGFDKLREDGRLGYIDSLFLCYSAMS